MKCLKLIDNKTVTKFKSSSDAAKWAKVSFGPECKIVFRDLLPASSDPLPAMMDVIKGGEIIARVLF